MSTSPYDLDLRRKVIEFIERGNTKAEAVRVFGLSLSTVLRWSRRYKTEGHVEPRKRLGSKPKIDVKALEVYVEKHPNVRLKDLSKEFGISINAMSRWMRKLKFSYKKNRVPTWKRTPRSELNFKKK